MYGWIANVCGVCFWGYRLAPYERRVTELLRNSKDKRARKLAKKRVSFLILSLGVFLYCLAWGLCIGEHNADWF